MGIIFVGDGKKKKTVSLGAKFVIVLLVVGSVPFTSEAQQNLTWDANDARMGVGGSGTWDASSTGHIGATTVEGTVSPGNSIGTLMVHGNYVQLHGSLMR